MRVQPWFTGLLVALLLLEPAAGGAVSEEPGPKRFIAGFHEFPRGLAPGHDYAGGRVLRVDPVLHFAVVEAQEPAKFRERARADERLRYLEEDLLLDWLKLTPDDPRFGEQYGPQQVRAPEAWDTTLGDADRNVCIVDTGVRYTHEDITGARWLGGRDFVNNDDDPWDDQGHGTHVAGIAAAGVNNAKGIAGIANVGVKAVKVLDASGSGTFSNVASGIRWCADNAGHVISMSLGASSGSTALQDAVDYAWGKGMLLVAAAGNDGPCTNCISFPARYANVIAVTCTTSSKAQCSFSSEGPESELAAPGSGILSTCFSNDASYCTKSGTSMSTPHASGVAALVWSHAPSLTNSGLRQLLRDHAQDLGPAGWDSDFGYGLVDAKATLDAAGGGGGAPPPPPPGEERRMVFEDFDDGSANGWSLDGLWHVSDACAAARSPPNYLGYNWDFTCTYDTFTRTAGAASFDVDLSGTTQATLRFQHRWETESFSGGAFDVMRVQASTDGGSTWTTLRQWDSRDANQPAWGPVALDIDAYAGKAVRFRFHFDSVDEVANDFPGWFIDDVEVTANRPNRAPVARIAPVEPAECTAGRATVTLDGSASSDPDGEPLTFAWSAPGIVFDDPASPRPTASFPLGTTTATLEVSDGELKGRATRDVTVVDSAAPVTRASLAGPPGDNGWWRGSVEVRFAAEDRCGVASTSRAVDGGAFEPGTSVLVAGDGSHAVRFFSTDVGGNVEAEKEVSLRIDATPPEAAASHACSVPGLRGWCRGEVSGSASASDATSGLASEACTLDDAAVACGTLRVAAQGPHTLAVAARDNAGNEAGAATSFRIDSVPPSLALLEPEPGNAYLDDTALLWRHALPTTLLLGTKTVRAGASDDTSGVERVEFLVDAVVRSTSPAAPYEFRWDAGAEAAGEHLLEARAFDEAGNGAVVLRGVRTAPTSLAGVKATCAALLGPAECAALPDS